MNIIILGAGAVGSLFGGLLSKDNDVVLVTREGHASAVMENGLAISGKTVLRSAPRAVTGVEGLPHSDILFITVKAYDTGEAANLAKALVDKNTTVVSLQNGLGNAEVIIETLGDVKLLCAVTSHGARLVGPGAVEHTGAGETVIGEYDGPADGKASEVAGLLSASGIETRVSDDIRVDIWTKVLVNAAINPLAASLGVRNGALLESESHKEIMEAIIAEGVRVAGTQGIVLSKDEVLEKALTVARLTAENKCSMLQDVELGRPTEIDHINGAIVRLAKEKGLDTPVNCRLAALIRAMETKGQRF